MKRFILLSGMAILVIGMTGCSTVLMKECEQQGNSQYFHCKRVVLAR